MAQTKASRLAYIDWMRGLACVLMFQTHCYDSWLSPSAKKSAFFMWSQLLGTLPAPLFLLLAGISFALMTTRLHERGATAREMAEITARRGLEILALGFLLRIQEYVIAFPWAPWTDLFRVDILNMIGVSLILMSGTVWACGGLSQGVHAGRVRQISVWVLGTISGVIALLIALVTPLIWTVWRPRGVPWPLQSYIDGVHNLGKPQPWLFPIFPWAAFAFAGLAIGCALLSAWGRRRPASVAITAGVFGFALMGFGKWLDARPQLYPVYDYWHTSPNFFLIRSGILLTILSASYLWCRWGLGQFGFSPLVQLGQTSLLVYWVHIEFVYGRLSILKKGQMSVAGASLGLLIIISFMLLISVMRTRFKGSLHAIWTGERSVTSADQRALKQPAGG